MSTRQGENAPGHAFVDFNPRLRDGLVVWDRRSVLKASLAGLAGISLPGLLRARSAAAAAGRPMPDAKSVILLWMTGGPSHIDTWDPKPAAPREIRGPFGTIPSALPGVTICEHLPKQAAMLDRMTIIRSVDARFSNHEPNHVMQTGNSEAEPRLNREGDMYPAIGSIVARFRGADDPALPPYVSLNLKSRSHLAWGGYLGKQYDPFLGTNVGNLFKLPAGLDQRRLESRQELREQFDRLRRSLDLSGSMQALDRFSQQAVDIVVGERAQAVFDLAQSRKPCAISMASTPGASRRCWRGGWSRPA